MVLISSKKYACETCIKGHRSSACKHTDRPLFEIKKKGRPVTQCEHCRELRKTKQVHVKCICEAKEPPSPTAATKKKGNSPTGAPTLPAHAAFPHGVPDLGSGSTTSDSDHGGLMSATESKGCSCKATGGVCNCCTPRTRPARRRSEPPPPASMPPMTTSNSSPSVPSSSTNNHCNPSPVLPATPHPSPNPTSSNPIPPRAPSHHILARIAELRPVLPRLSARDAALMQGTTGQHDLFHHSPGLGHHPGHGHCHPHGEHFSPYGRAYDYALHADYHSDAGSSTGGFYKQDARSAESLLSVGSLMSAGTGVSAGAASQSQPPPVGGQQQHRSQKSVSQKSHSQKSPSYDGHPGSFFGAPEVEWRLPPSLSRASTDAPSPGPAAPTSASKYGRPTPERANGGGVQNTSNTNASSNVAAFAPRPRSEEAYPLGTEPAFGFFASRPRSEAAVAVGHPRAGSDPTTGSNIGIRPRSDDGMLGVRTCGCGAGCACPGCALHGVAVSSESAGGTNGNTQNKNRRHCADAACGGACLDCTILGLPDFGPVVGLGGGGNNGGAGYGNNKAGGEVYTKEGEYDAGANVRGFDGGEYGGALAYDPQTYGDLDLDLEYREGYDLDLGREQLSELEQQRQSQAIDEWIREVGVGPAFEFEGFEAFEHPAPPASSSGSGSSSNSVPGAGSNGMDFDGMDFEQQFGAAGQAWVFDVGGDVRMQGLTSAGAGADVPPMPPSGGAFLTVPGPGTGHAHGRSRSSSSASSEVSVPGAGVGVGVGIAALGVAAPALDPHPHPHAMALDRAVPAPAPAPLPVPALVFPPPLPAAYLDEQMLFF